MKSLGSAICGAGSKKGLEMDPVKTFVVGVSLSAIVGALLLVPGPRQAHAQPARKKPAASNTSKLKTASQPFVALGCDKSLSTHVYNPKRLQVIQECIEITGTIHHTKKEPDGDDHIQLKVDPQFASLLNDKNNSVQAGCLIIEPVCMGAVTQKDAIASCRDFHSPIRAVPQDGSKVKVLGSYVWDTEGGHGWMEIHPVTSISAM